MRNLTWLFIVTLNLFFAHGMIIEYHKSAILSGDTLIWSSTIFSKEDSPAGNDDPSVSIDAVFTRNNETTYGRLQVLIYNVLSTRLGTHMKEDNTIQYCCTPADYEAERCYNLNIGSVIRLPDVPTKDIIFEKLNLTATLSMSIPVTMSGPYALQITNCNGNGVGDVVIEGKAVWKNPYGYLPGEVYMMLHVSGILALCYLGVVIFFGILCIKYYNILMKLQIGVFGVIFFGMIEIASWYFYLVGTNNTGYYSVSALLFVVFLANIKLTLALVLMLLVSMGLGVVKWTLGTTRIKIALLAIFQLFFSFLKQTIKEVETLEKNANIVNDWITLLVVIPAITLTTCFYYWIVLSLIRTMQQLTLRRQILKQQMYKGLFAVLAVSSVLSGLVFLYQAYLILTSDNIPWQNKWIVEAFWELLFFGIMTSIAILWRPRANNTRYGYAEYFTDEEDSEAADPNNIPLETINVITGGDLTHRRKTPEEKEHQHKPPPPQEKYDSDREKNIKKARIPLTEFDKEIMTIELSDDEDVTLDDQLRKLD